MNKITTLVTTAEVKNPYLLALAGPKLVAPQQQPPDASIRALIEVLEATYLTLNRVPDAPLNLLAHNLYREVERYFKTLTTGDIKIAFENGCRGMYGEVFDTSLAVFHRWLKAYQKSEERAEAMRINTQLKAEKYRQPLYTEAEAHELWKDTLRKQFARFKQTGVLQVYFPSRIYNFFEARGDIKLSRAEKDAIWLQATANVTESLKRERLKIKGKMDRLQTLQAAIRRIEANTPGAADQTLIRIEAKLLALTQYFTSIEKLEL